MLTPSLTFHSLFLNFLMLFFIAVYPSSTTFFSRCSHNSVNANVLHADPRLLPRLITRDQDGVPSYSSGYRGTYGCTCDKKYTYAVCAEQGDQVVKLQLDPFAIVAGAAAGNIMRSCDLYDTGNESTSLVFCIQGWGSFTIWVYNASDLTTLLSFVVPDQSNIGVVPHILVDTPNRVLYVSNNVDPGYVFKFSNIDNITAPTYEGNCSLNDGGSQLPAMMVKVDDLLFVYHNLNPGRLSSINLTTFTWNATIDFATNDGLGDLDNVVADHNYVYVLIAGGASNPSIIRCSFRNNEFRIVNVLKIGIGSSLYSIAISPDLSYLLLPVASSGLMIVNTSPFKLETRTLWTPLPAAVFARDANVLSSKNEDDNEEEEQHHEQEKRHAQAQRGPNVGFGDGRPIITHDGRIYAPRSDYGVRFYNFTHQRADQVYPTLRPIKDATISDSALALGSSTKLPLACVANANETFFVCSLYFGGIVKYNLRPISFALSVSMASDQPRCDIFENASSSLIVCTRYDPSFTGLETLNATNFASVAKWTSPDTFAKYSWVLVDSPSATAYASSYQPAPNSIIYKVAAIDSLAPFNVGNITFVDADYPTMRWRFPLLLSLHQSSPAHSSQFDQFHAVEWNRDLRFGRRRRWLRANGERRQVHLRKHVRWLHRTRRLRRFFVLPLRKLSESWKLRPQFDRHHQGCSIHLGHRFLEEQPSYRRCRGFLAVERQRIRGRRVRSAAHSSLYLHHLRLFVKRRFRLCLQHSGRNPNSIDDSIHDRIAFRNLHRQRNSVNERARFAFPHTNRFTFPKSC